jgi:undecaprenyl-diphosphatase
MPVLVIAVILGLVEGVTEFLPVSSTGHLILAGRLLGFTGETAGTFEIFIQLGAILAVVVHYRKVFFELLRPPMGDGFSGTRGLGLLGWTTVPGLVAGLLAHGFIKAHLFTPITVAAALFVGAIWILLTERYYRHHAPRGLDRLDRRTAIGIGLFQCLALWPGMSRSTCTILGAMLLGLDRVAATQYSFFAAVPLLAAATGYDLLKSLHALHASDIPLFGVGFVVAYATAWLAIRFFVRFVSRHSLAVFGWYRLALAAVVALVLAHNGHH